MKYKVTLNGKTYEVEVEKGEAILAAEYDAAAPAPAAAPVAAAPVAAAPAAAPAPAAADVGDGEVVSSPLPGVVVGVKVAAGDKVTKGQVLVLIEAMKMENEIAAPRDGVVAKVLVSKSASVESGSPLLTLA